MNWFNEKTKCVILCAGEGKRLYPFLDDKPKAMVEVNNRPLISYVIDYWKNFTDKFIFVVKYKKEQIIDFVKTVPIKAEFVEQKELRGIAHALFYAEKSIVDNFIVVLGDCICHGNFSFPENMNQGIGIWQTDNTDDIKRSYSVEISNNFISKVVEKPKVFPNNLCGMGFYFFDRKVFDYIKVTPPSPLRNEIEITDVIQKMVNAGEKISPVCFNGDYLNITYPEDLKRAEKLLCA